MVNRTTSAQRYNKRLDNIFDTWRKHRQDRIDYLCSHIEIEHILMDSMERYKTEDFDTLTDLQLWQLADEYDYNS